jgi:L-ascorbate metabolism protein UlaG (beta-lactamase superfamily)
MVHRPAIEFLGHSTLAIELDGLRLITDPAFRARIGPLRRTTAEPAARRLGRPDVVLVSHLHWDHLDLPSLRALGRDIRVLVPAGAGDWLRRHGFGDVVELPVGRVHDLGGIAVEAVTARHGGTRPPLGPTAEAIGYLIRGSRSLWFAGDTALHQGMAELEDIDTALVPVWGWGPTLRRSEHLDPGSAAEALRLARPRTAVPIHWGTYWPRAMGRVRPGRLTEPPHEFAAAAGELAPDVAITGLAVGERLLLP